jgi:NAD(P)-dependent dehydrogenase (short-subunit alcohol dehydrogenase family)
MDKPPKAAFAVGGADSACGSLCLELSKRGYEVCLVQYGIGKQSSRQSGTADSLGPAELALTAKEFSASDLSSSIVGTAEKYGGIDALIYQCPPETGPSNADMLLDLDEKDWDDAMNSGAKGLFLACKFILPYLISRPGSVIIILEGQSPALSEASLTKYAASRALDALLEHMSQELSQYGILIIRKRTRDEREWMPDVLAELEKRGAALSNGGSSEMDLT